MHSIEIKISKNKTIVLYADGCGFTFDMSGMIYDYKKSNYLLKNLEPVPAYQWMFEVKEK